jgi:hypothetical protein
MQMSFFFRIETFWHSIVLSESFKSIYTLYLPRLYIVNVIYFLLEPVWDSILLWWFFKSIYTLYVPIFTLWKGLFLLLIPILDSILLSGSFKSIYTHYVPIFTLWMGFFFHLEPIWHSIVLSESFKSINTLYLPRFFILNVIFLPSITYLRFHSFQGLSSQSILSTSLVLTLRMCFFFRLELIWHFTVLSESFKSIYTLYVPSFYIVDVFFLPSRTYLRYHSAFWVFEVNL